MNRIELDNRRRAIKILNIMGWHAVPIENKAQNGSPDLNASKRFILLEGPSECVEIWIEFKIVEEWPKRDKTAIKIPHFTTEQKAWFKLRIRHNPNCFIMIQIEEDHFLYKVDLNLLECLGTSWNQQQMYNHCLSVCKDQAGILDSLEKGLTR